MELQLVLVNLKFSDEKVGTLREYRVFSKVEAVLEAYLESHPEVGMLDGNEIGLGFYTIYCYGPDADRLYAAILPILRRRLFPTGLAAFFRPFSLPKGSHVVLEYGEPGAEQKKIPLT